MLASAQGILAVDLGDSALELRHRSRHLHSHSGAQASSDPASWWEQLQAYVENPTTSLEAPLDLQGTRFQRAVYAKLQTIEAGRTVTYTDLALTLGKAKGIRAVAGACARNRLALAVPCHRVVGRQGALTGYRWGLARKAAILQHEAVLTGRRPPTLFDP